MSLVHIFRRYWIAWMLGGLSLVLLVAAAVFGYAQLHGVDFPLIVHFDIVHGLNVHGDPADMYALVVLGFVFLFLDMLVVATLLVRDEILGYLTAGVSVFVSLCILITIVGVVQLNF